MSSKSRYRIGEIVRIKATGEKVKILGYWNDFSCKPCEKFVDVSFPYIVSSKDGECFGESELKPFRPSRTGKYRDSNGRFCRPWYIKREFMSMDEMLGKTDSKQRNYKKIEKLNIVYDWVKYPLEQSIVNKINEIIDELGRRV